MSQHSEGVAEHAAVHLAHAALQAIAEDAGVEILHIKGPALDVSLLETRVVTDAETHRVAVETVPRRSVDADVLVRPTQIGKFLKVLAQNGWSAVLQPSDGDGLRTDRQRGRWVASHFQYGSAFEHDAAFTHPFLGQADIHRRFPGIRLDADEAFGWLWRERRTTVIANYPCWVPSIPAQRLIVILHAVRGGSADHRDIRRAWIDATADERLHVDRLAVQLQAEVALAAGTGRLRDYASSPEHDLWRLLSEGNRSLLSLWWARVRAAPTAWSGVRTGARLVVPTPRRLAIRLGRAMTRRELLAAYVEQGKRGVGALAMALRKGGN